jgi:UDP-glucose 4-epimerase
MLSKALVTGGAGFIGSHIVEALIDQGCAVTVLDNLSTGSESNLVGVENKINFIEGDIRDRQVLNRVAEGCDTIFHLAAVVSVPETIERPVDSASINDMGTLFVLQAARQKGVRRVVFSSSCAVYGDDPQLPKDETINPVPSSPYAVQKLTGEHYLRLGYELYGLETVSLRYFNVYGPRQDPSSPYSGVISIFMNRAVNNQAPVIFGDGKQSRDFIYVDDVVKANLMAATVAPAKGDIINIGTGSAIRIMQLWDMICDVSGVAHRPRYEPARAGDIHESFANIDYARKRLGFEIEYPFENGLALTYKWYRQALRSADRNKRTEGG